MLKPIYLLIKQRLGTITSLEKVAWLNNEEVDRVNSEELYQVPAAYIEFDPVVMQDLGERLQQATITFRVHLITSDYDQEELHNYFTLIESIYTTLSNYEAMLSDIPSFASLQGTAQDICVINHIRRTAILPDHDQARMTKTIQEFQFLTIDTAHAYSRIQRQIGKGIGQMDIEDDFIVSDAPLTLDISCE